MSDSGDRLRIASLALFASCLTMHAQAGTPVGAMLNTKIDETQLVSLVGNTRSAALVLENDRGPVEDDLQLDHLLLLLQRPAATQATLDKLVDALQTPGSPDYHQWLTPQQFGKRFGLAAVDTNTVTEWLEAHGMTIHRVYGNGMLIDFSARAGQVREAFHTELHTLDVDGEQHISNVNDPMVPAALAPAIRGIVSLHDFRPHSLRTDVARSHVDVRTGQLITAPAVDPEYAFTARGESFQAVTPGDLATIYNLNPLFAAGYTGQGQTIAVIEDTNVYAASDWTTFRNTFGLAKYKTGTFTQVHPGSCTNPGVNADDGEAILDTEYASASAPGATIELASCANTRTTFGGLLALAGLVNASTLPAIVSISYGECEAENGAAANAAYSTLYQQAAAEGVSVFVASGDEGAAGCDNGAPAATHGINVNGFASTAYNVAVGGTDFGDTYAGDGSAYWSSTDSSTDASAKSYINEIPWNDSCAGALLASASTGSAAAYGANGFCNSAVGRDYYLSTAAGSGGPSSCSSGTPKSFGVTSSGNGGSCKGNGKPSWQTGVLGVPTDGVRDLPDVSLFGANGIWGHYYIYCNSDKANGGTPCTGAPSGWSGGGGTSFAAPIMAGIQALVDQRTGARQGNPDPVYYKLAANEYGRTGSAICNSAKGSAVSSSCVFHDITQGDIDVNCTGSNSCYQPSGTNGVLSTASNAPKPAYSATPGFDLATGIGSVNAYNLVMSWPGASGLLKTAKVNSGAK